MYRSSDLVLGNEQKDCYGSPTNASYVLFASPVEWQILALLYPMDVDRKLPGESTLEYSAEQRVPLNTAESHKPAISKDQREGEYAYRCEPFPAFPRVRCVFDFLEFDDSVCTV